MNSYCKWIKGLPPVKRKAVYAFGGMCSRCRNMKNPKYHRYGGRGIEVRIIRQDFIDWYIRESKGRTDLTVDRIDNDGHYELDNMQLITRSENSKKAHRESEATQKANTEKGKAFGVVQSQAVRVCGMVYPSMKDASLGLGKAHNYIFNRMRHNGGIMPNGSRIEVC